MLRAAVAGIGGAERPGQVEMVRAVERRRRERRAPARAGRHRHRQVAGLPRARGRPRHRERPARRRRDRHAGPAGPDRRPRHARAWPRRSAPLLGRRPTYALVKGRRNYVCVHKLEGGFPDDDEGALLSVGAVDADASRLGRRGRAAARVGRRDRLRRPRRARPRRLRAGLAAGVGQRRASASAAVPRCVASASSSAPAATAHDVDIVVTNHSFMAIDAFEGRQMLPEHDVLVVDEAHELVDRVTVDDHRRADPGAMIAAAAKRAGRLADTGRRWSEAGDVLAGALEPLPEGRLTRPPRARSALALARVRDAGPRRPERAQAAAAARRARRRPGGRAGRGRRGLRRRRAHPRGPRARRRRGSADDPRRGRCCGSRR